jgi:hypothetical protein
LTVLVTVKGNNDKNSNRMNVEQKLLLKLSKHWPTSLLIGIELRLQECLCYTLQNAVIINYTTTLKLKLCIFSTKSIYVFRVILIAVGDFLHWKY